MEDEKKRSALPTMSDQEQIAKLLSDGTGGDGRPAWFPVGLSLREWATKAGDYVTDEGVLLRTERGVFVIGLMGSCKVGSYAPDGTIDRSTADVHVAYDYEAAEVIIEAADPPGHEKNYARNPETGKLELTQAYLDEINNY